MSIIKGLFVALKNLRVIPFNEMTPEIHDTLGSNLAKVMMVAKMSDAKLTKAQREYVVNQAKQLQEFEDRYITGVKDKSGNVIKSDEGIKDTKSARIFNRMGEELDPKKPIVGGTQRGKKIDQDTLRRLAERGPQLIKQKIADRKINEVKDVKQRIDSGVAATVEKMLAMEPIDAMKEANRVIKREGPYKNLTQEDAKKILQDTEDHIFERNIKPKETDMDFDDNDFAEGGRIGFRIGSDSGKDVSGREYGAPSAAAQSVSTSPSRDNGSSGGNNLTDTTTKQVLEDAGRTAVKNVVTNKAMEKLGLGGMFGMAPQVAALLGIINSVRNSQTDEENMFADGGRIGFKKGMDRRTFMKIMGGLTTLPIVGKFFKGAEVAAPAVEKAAEATSGAPAYFFNLVKKIKNLGDDVTNVLATSERQKVTKYKDYELTEDLTTGEKTIQRIKVDGDNPTRYDEVLAEETYMNYKPGKGQADEATGGKVADEYTEDTSYIDKKGTVYDTVEGVADDVIEEGTVFEDNVADFATKEAPSIKKAGGGIARMLGE